MQDGWWSWPPAEHSSDPHFSAFRFSFVLSSAEILFTKTIYKYNLLIQLTNTIYKSWPNTLPIHTHFGASACYTQDWAPPVIAQ